MRYPFHLTSENRQIPTFTSKSQCFTEAFVQYDKKNKDMDKNSETSLFLLMTSFVKFKKIKTNEKTTNSNT